MCNNVRDRSVKKSCRLGEITSSIILHLIKESLEPIWIQPGLSDSSVLPPTESNIRHQHVGFFMLKAWQRDSKALCETQWEQMTWLLYRFNTKRKTELDTGDVKFRKHLFWGLKTNPISLDWVTLWTYKKTKKSQFPYCYTAHGVTCLNASFLTHKRSLV